MFDGGYCDCNCDDFYRLSCEFDAVLYVELLFFKTGYYGATTNISLFGSTILEVYARYIDQYDCEEAEAHWEIVRADGVTELYTVFNNDEYHYGRNEEFPDIGLTLWTNCYHSCDLYMIITPRNLTYHEAEITCVITLPECFSSSNTTETTTLRIQGSCTEYL